MHFWLMLGVTAPLWIVPVGLALFAGIGRVLGAP